MTVGFMAVLMLIMSVGVIFRRPPLKGSCGGVGSEDCFCIKEALMKGYMSPPINGGQVQTDGVVVYDGAGPQPPSNAS